jgi:hypothetical protein
MEQIYDEIRRLKELEVDYKIIRILRCYMAFYNVRSKTLCENLNVSKSTLSKILNEKKDEVSDKVWNEVILKILENIEFHKIVTDFCDFDSISSEMPIPLISPPDSEGSRHPVPMQVARGFRRISPPLVGA